MAISVNTNLAAMSASRQVARASSDLQSSMERLSSGLRINRAADDAAGLGISSRMRGTVSALDQAGRNAQDAISMVQTADGAVGSVQGVLTRIRDLALQYNNGVYSAEDQASITAEVAQLSAELTRLSGTAFNGKALFGGGTAASFQIGVDATDTITLDQVDALTAIGSVVADFVANGATTTTLTDLDTAINDITRSRSTLGALQNRMSMTIDGLNNYKDNLIAAKSRIEDVDVASEMSNFTRLQIRQQAGVSMLAQANQAPNIVLSLLGR